MENINAHNKTWDEDNDEENISDSFEVSAISDDNFDTTAEMSQANVTSASQNETIPVEDLPKNGSTENLIVAASNDDTTPVEDLDRNGSTENLIVVADNTSVYEDEIVTVPEPESRTREIRYVFNFQV